MKMPKNSLKNTQKNQGIKIKGVETISEAMESIFKLK